jgi:hypothetical protein
MSGSRGLRTVALVGLVLTAVVACGRSPATRFYALMPVASPTEPAPASMPISIGIRSVELPATLDRSQIATRTGPHTFAFAEFDRWSAPLADHIAHVLAENLAVRLHSDQVSVYPWPPRAAVDYEVMVEVTRLDGQLGGPCVLDARWRIQEKAGPGLPLFGRSTLTEAAGRDYASLVAAHSRLVDGLSADIAAALRKSGAMTRRTTDGRSTR